ncbi:unnamed protein product [Closterium sp. NIES-53]
MPAYLVSDPNAHGLNLKQRLLGSRGKGRGEGMGRVWEGGRGGVREGGEGKGEVGGEEWAVVDAVQLPPPPSDAEAVEHWARAMIIDARR